MICSGYNLKKIGRFFFLKDQVGDVKKERNQG